MKKRVKLFMTIISLCLSLSMLTFGVIASSNIKYSVEGSVKYEIKDVLVTIDTKISRSKEINYNKEAMPYLDYDLIGQDSYCSYENGQIDTNEEISFGEDLDATFNGYFIYMIEFNVNTINQTGVDVRLTAQYEKNLNYEIYIDTKHTETSPFEEDANLNAFIYILDYTTAIKSTDFEIKLSIELL